MMRGPARKVGEGRETAATLSHERMIVAELD